MRINNNIMALNTHRQLGINNTNTSKSLEKLSSGYRINRAGDDAAGLAISEKMRGQIRGLNMASKNAQDGISLIQTAEGALTETHAILQRMRELAVQSANDTNTEADRAELQKEVDQLSQEISRIANNTEFNTQKLLNGGFSGAFHIGANENQKLDLAIEDMRGFTLGVAGSAKYVEEAKFEAATTGPTIANGTYYIDETNLKDADGNVVATTSDDGVTWTAGTDGDTYTFTQQIDSGTITIADGKATGTAEFDNAGLEAGKYTIKFGDTGASTLVDANGNVIAEATDHTEFKTLDPKATTVFKLDKAVVSATDGMKITVGGTDISTQKTANKAITTIQKAIENVSAERSKLGAHQNRLEHTIKNLDTSAENLQSAESRIRDVDMAKEMMEFTKQNILQQAATAMLAQANMAPQTVLKLLG